MRNTLLSCGCLALVLGIGSQVDAAINGSVAYIFDDTAGTDVPDNSTIGDNDGTLGGGALTSTDVPFAYGANRSLALDGTDDFLTINTSGTSLTSMSTDATLEMWVKSTNNTDEHWLARVARNGSSNYYGIRTNNGIVQAFYGNGSQFVQSSGTLPLNTWTHLAVTFDHLDTGVNIYINGTQDGSGTFNDADPGSVIENGVLFREGAGANYFQGFVDEVRISAGILDESTIVYDSQHTLVVPEPALGGLVAAAGTLLMRRARR